VRFQILTAASMKMTVFWDIARWNMVECSRRFRGAYCLNRQGDDGGSKHLWNVGHYTEQYPRRQVIFTLLVNTITSIPGNFCLPVGRF
jgi:hypothetical protein